MTEREEEILALHRQVAAERLRADQGWERAEAKSRECLALRERIAALEPVGVVVAAHPVHGWHMHELKPWDEIGAGTTLYANPVDQRQAKEAGHVQA